ncbi:GntR family transcriptional regulator [Aliirhizobium smilacinae]|uniref:GntR family transcriptional regulator n=1 Tax=Aliirhizobium smilacinae TaxID=1395944 RepID=A0A5C4XQX9_9HYPH|nr:GntR family transcriptional regulator [Rhizobium smilacinae]TNM65361.1 GntR family transcriptional regulator [Rhizobium smilacinae]
MPNERHNLSSLRRRCPMLLISDKTQNAYMRIKQALLRHETAPNTFINIRTVATRMRVSPTPVREALIRLADEDVIQFAAGRGYYSKPIKADEVKAEYEMAFMIAKYSIEKNKIEFDRIPPVLVPEIRGQSDLSDKENEADGVANYLETLYERLAMISGNPKLVKVTHQFGERTHHIRRFGLMVEPEFIEFYSHMSGLEKLLLEGDQASALKSLVQQHHAKSDILQHVLEKFEFRAETSKAVLEDLLG